MACRKGCSKQQEMNVFCPSVAGNECKRDAACDADILKSWKIHARKRQFDCSKKADRKWQGPFYFIQAADLQLGMIQRIIEENPDPGWQKEVEIGRRVIDKVNQLTPKPKFFVICGNLCDALPDEKSQLRQLQEVAFKRIFSKLNPDIPLVCVGGNRDFGDSPTKHAIDMFNSNFGDDYFSFWCGGVLFLVLNSQLLMDGSKVPELAHMQTKWLTQELNQAKKSGSARIIVFQHVPWFIHDPDETPGNELCISPEVRTVWLEKLKESGVVHVFAGHLHRNEEGSYKGMPMTTTTALGGQLGDDQPGLRVVKVGEHDVQHVFYSLDDLPTTVIL